MVATEALKKIFKDSSDKSTIEIKNKCADCGCDVLVNITSTSGGFGLQGGVLLACLPEGFITKCLNCYKVNSNTYRDDELTS